MRTAECPLRGEPCQCSASRAVPLPGKATKPEDNQRYVSTVLRRKARLGCDSSASGSHRGVITLCRLGSKQATCLGGIVRNARNVACLRDRPIATKNLVCVRPGTSNSESPHHVHTDSQSARCGRHPAESAVPRFPGLAIAQEAHRARVARCQSRTARVHGAGLALLTSTMLWRQEQLQCPNVVRGDAIVWDRLAGRSLPCLRRTGIRSPCSLREKACAILTAARPCRGFRLRQSERWRRSACHAVARHDSADRTVAGKVFSRPCTPRTALHRRVLAPEEKSLPPHIRTRRRCASPRCSESCSLRPDAPPQRKRQSMERCLTWPPPTLHALIRQQHWRCHAPCCVHYVSWSERAVHALASVSHTVCPIGLESKAARASLLL